MLVKFIAVDNKVQIDNNYDYINKIYRSIDSEGLIKSLEIDPDAAPFGAGAIKELDDEGLLVRRSGGFSKPNHLYVKIPSDEIGLQPVDNKAVEKMVATESEKQPSSGRKNGCAGVGNVAPSKVTEKYKSNKYHEVNYCYGEGESL